MSKSEAAEKANRPAQAPPSLLRPETVRGLQQEIDIHINIYARSHCRCKAAGGWWLIGRSGSLAPFLQCSELLMWNPGSIRKVCWIQKQSSLITAPAAQGEFPISNWALVSLPPISQHAMFVFSLIHLAGFGPCTVAEAHACLFYDDSQWWSVNSERVSLQDPWHNFQLIWLPLAKLMTQVIKVPIKRMRKKTMLTLWTSIQ